MNWKAKRVGNRYCAPACGRGCTRGEYKEAMRKARILSAYLGPKWKPEVWENLGWHWKSQHGENGIYVSGGYRHFLAETKEGYVYGKGSTPGAALKEMYERFRAERDEAAVIVSEMERAALERSRRLPSAKLLHVALEGGAR